MELYNITSAAKDKQQEEGRKNKTREKLQSIRAIESRTL